MANLRRKSNNISEISIGWAMCRGPNQVKEGIGDFYRDGSAVKHVNRTFITLIPKVKNPISLKDYKPISLVRVVYKILAKVLASRLKKVMDFIISLCQMTFVMGRQIVDSFVITGEIIHSWKKSNLGGLVVKLDFGKAYDIVDHEFLFEILSRMGFGSKWVEWIRWCVISPLMSVLVNGCPMKEFPVERGLRLGDPLSSFLFNMVVVVLSKMLYKARECGLIKGIGFKNDVSKVSELILHKSCLEKIGKKFPGDDEWARVFSCEQSVLWKEVICAKYNMRISNLMWDCPVSKTCSAFVKSINKLFDEKHRFYKLIQEGFQMVIGFGEKVRLWEDVKWDSITLKIDFPRIYALARNKDGMIKEFGSFVDSK
ncbi:hypothetical protein Ddye_019915 [Dipteronia dyeriana]|uniref:Reverse transcriptase domain-containing protein n=1 Tax=Dipteronia dyeriana TaxID=168575 RepID=A0AAD9TYT8_9ROSI|nr:hypothetical protein Ddye_019915 [Dipteronia dyeriana]